MRKLASLFVWSTAALLTACGGGSDEDAFRTPAPAAAGGVTPTVAAVSLSANRTTILSDGSETAEITAFVRDAGNVGLATVPVTFAASSGALEVLNNQTGSNGNAVATLRTAGNSTPRTVTVTATAGGVSGTIQIQVAAAAPPPAVNSLSVTTSSPTIPSDGSLPATITAVARNQANQFMSGVGVVFSASSGGVTVVNGTTNASGQASATLSSASDPTNRSITVTATAGAVAQTVNVSVVGTRLSVQGAAALVQGATSTYTVELLDSGNRGISGRTLTVASARGNTIAPASVTTDSTGRATFNATITQAGNETLTVSGLGLAANQAVAVNSASFVFTAPTADGVEVPLSTPQTFTIRWLNGGTPQVGQPVTFTSTRGTVTPIGGAVTTNASGDATVTISSTNAGGASIVATAGSATATRQVEFVASTAAALDLQASVATVSPNEQSTLLAVVRDPAGNLVKNKTVSFTLDDVTGGTISVASAVTNSEGRAQTVYTAGSTVSAANGVRITASVQGASSTISRTVSLTTARKELFISLGTGNTITEPTVSQYQIEYAIFVTDATGNGVANVALTTSVLSLRYGKGTRAFPPGASSWQTPGIACTDEDTLVPATARNGVLDPGEDFNNSGRIEAGNIAVVAPRQVTTNAQGLALVTITYPQEHAFWLEVVFEARTSVQGTEFARATTFVLPGAANDFGTQGTSPPGFTSPFGVNACSAPN
jgi:hypothetical protein